MSTYILSKVRALTLIDAGVKTKEAWGAFQFQLAQIGLVPEDIEQIVLTHHHPGPCRSFEWLPEDVPVYGHEYVRPWIEEDEHFFLRYDEFYKGLFSEFGIKGNFSEMLKMMKEPLRYSSNRPLTYEIVKGTQSPD